MVQSETRALNNFTLQSCLGDCLHVAIIIDGNRRWAAKRGLPRALSAGGAK